MKRVAIVGVEGSGKTVMLAGLGELYSHPDENGCFLAPKNFATASYVSGKIARMRKGEWPGATAEDVLQGLDWTLRRKRSKRDRPVDICEISCLDFAGETYRTAFGIRSESGQGASDEVDALKSYIREADEIIVLINLRDVIEKGNLEPRVQEAIWITNSILAFALDKSNGRAEPRAAIVLSQADSYAGTIEACGGARGVLESYLPLVANSYGWLDVFEAYAVDKTKVDDDGNLIPAPDFNPVGLRSIVEWILHGISVTMLFTILRAMLTWTTRLTLVTIVTGIIEKSRIHRRPGSVAIAAAIQNKYNIPVIPHLICFKSIVFVCFVTAKQE